VPEVTPKGQSLINKHILVIDDDYLCKPFTADPLTAKILKLLP
jgi:hypothetical protein